MTSNEVLSNLNFQNEKKDLKTQPKHQQQEQQQKYKLS